MSKKNTIPLTVQDCEFVIANFYLLQFVFNSNCLPLKESPRKASALPCPDTLCPSLVYL